MCCSHEAVKTLVLLTFGGLGDIRHLVCLVSLHAGKVKEFARVDRRWVSLGGRLDITEDVVEGALSLRFLYLGCHHNWFWKSLGLT